jgi:hypothetical protein
MTFSERGPDTDPRYNMTSRLMRYVRDAVTKKPLLHIERETGVPYSTLRDIALAQAKHLAAHHKFPTPRVLAMDGLKLYKKEFMVIADGETGSPIGFLPTILATNVRAWTRDNLDEKAVKVFVADLHKTNTSVAGIRFGAAIHVADKWHVIERYQRALSHIVNAEIDQQRKSGSADIARTIWDLKPAIMAVDPRKQRWRRYPKKPQRTFNFANDLEPIFERFPNISRAFRARGDFLQFYGSRSLDEAMPHLDRCRARLVPVAGLAKVKAFWKHLDKNWTPISAYFETVRLRPSGKWRGETTNLVEQRNREIRKLGDARNGVQDFDLLRMLALYHRWHVGNEIVFCSEPGCPATWGPVLGPIAPEELRAAAGTYPRCANHA